MARILFIASLALSPPAFAGGPDDTPRIGPVDPEWLRIAAGIPPNIETDETRLSHAHPGRILRWGTLLALRLDNGRFVWLTDIQGPPWGQLSSEQYWLNDYWPDHGVYIVGVQRGRRSEHWLISQRSAAITRLNAVARRDPADPHLFITAGSATMGATVAEAWEGEGDAWVRRYRCDALREDAEFLRWDGPGRAILAARDPRDRTQEFHLTKIDGKWHTNACRSS